MNGQIYGRSNDSPTRSCKALRIHQIAVFADGNGVARTLLTCCVTLIVEMQPLPRKSREAAAFILHIKQHAAVRIAQSTLTSIQRRAAATYSGMLCWFA